jgi:hypothetical protein
MLGYPIVGFSGDGSNFSAELFDTKSAVERN